MFHTLCPMKVQHIEESCFEECMIVFQLKLNFPIQLNFGHMIHLIFPLIFPFLAHITYDP